ncbi:MAG: DNA gyrase inhibitor YacG [Gammaproteobacteria bacterium]|nr:DNA gyrase inhibitor YacG [Gammaproteobacteria bacterium]
MKNQDITTNCPTCNSPVKWESNSIWRPFCSKRCKLIDLGDWLDENHRIPDTNRQDTDTTV